MEEINLATLLHPVRYERRMVIFFDTLGWKTKIELAGSDPDKIAQLSLLPRLLKLSFIDKLSAAGDRKLSAFSDCAAVSMPYDESDIERTLRGLCAVVAGAAVMGFFIRGAVTVGDLYHDDEVIFGPALNRAYLLETNGGPPRIILDPDIEAFHRLSIDGIFNEDNKLFLDPFVISHFVSSREAHASTGPYSGLQLYELVARRAKEELDRATDKKVREKYEWLYTRMSERITRIA